MFALSLELSELAVVATLSAAIGIKSSVPPLLQYSRDLPLFSFLEAILNKEKRRLNQQTNEYN